jgi:hypothetical protein
MTLGAAYATADEYRTATGGQSGLDDAPIYSDLTAISRHINRLTGRPLGFNAGLSGTSRVYMIPEFWRPWPPEPDGPTMDIEDFAAISAIAVDLLQNGTYSQALAVNTDCELLPRGAAALPEPHPYSAVRLLPYGALRWWPAGVRLRVTGTPGWPAVPAAIKSATIQLTAILRLESPRATSRINEMNQVLSASRVAQNIIQDLIETYAAESAVAVAI